MKNKTTTTFIIMLMIVLSMSLINARNDFEQIQQSGVFNSTTNYILNSITFEYSTIDRPTSLMSGLFDLGGTKDYIKSGKPNEIGIGYTSTIKDWNNQYIDNKVPICQIQIRKLNKNQDTFSTPFNVGLLLNKNITELSDVNDYFIVQLYDNEYFYVNTICLFSNKSNINYTGMNMPFSMQTFSPTYNCKPCQFSEFSQHLSDTIKKDTFDNYDVNIKNYTKGFIDICFEIFIYSFWVLLIVLFFSIIALIFWGGYWLYFYLRSLGK